MKNDHIYFRNSQLSLGSNNCLIFIPDTSSLSWLIGTAFFILIMATMATVLSWIGRTTEQQTVNQYLFGGKKMSTLPIAVSFIARLDHFENSSYQN